MSRLFEQIDSQPSDLGEITLRRRRIPALGDRDIYEVKLGDEFLMSSMFVDAEVALADLGLAAVSETGDRPLDVVVGGLGLGYTAEAALRHERVGALWVVEALDTVIRWHQEEKVPLGQALNKDDRCQYVLGSFFDLAMAEPGEPGLDPTTPERRFDAILLDIDHSPSALLNADNARFYTEEGLRAMARQLRPSGVFALWSNDPPDADFTALLARVFGEVNSHVVSFYNPFQNRESANTVYVARC